MASAVYLIIVSCNIKDGGFAEELDMTYNVMTVSRRHFAPDFGEEAPDAGSTVIGFLDVKIKGGMIAHHKHCLTICRRYEAESGPFVLYLGNSATDRGLDSRHIKVFVRLHGRVGAYCSDVVAPHY